MDTRTILRSSCTTYAIGWLAAGAFVASLGVTACEESTTNANPRVPEAGAGTTTDGAPGQTGGSTGSGGASKSSGGAVISGSGGATAIGDSGNSRGRDGGSGGHAPRTDAGSGGRQSGASSLPLPPDPASVARPSGAAANLRVLPWAGFTAAVTYTFDDSSPSQVDHYKDIAAAGVPVTFYITTGNSYYAGYEATWKAALAAGHELGNHTVYHCNFDQACGGAAAGSSVSEVDGATSYIENTLGAANVWTMAYPFGDTGYEPLAQTRFFVARGVGGGTVKPGGATDPWNLPIFGAQGGESASVLNDHVDAARAEGSWLIFLFHSLAPNSEAWYAPVDVANVTASMAHAKSAADTWIDTLANVGAYWIGQRVVEGAAKSSTALGQRLTWSVPKNFPPGKYVRVLVDGGELSQKSVPLVWNGHGFYEVALDAGELTLK